MKLSVSTGNPCEKIVHKLQLVKGGCEHSVLMYHMSFWGTYSLQVKSQAKKSFFNKDGQDIICY